MVDQVHEIVALVADVRRIAVEHGVFAVVVREEIGPVEVLNDHIPEPFGELVEAVNLVRARQRPTQHLRGPESGWVAVLPVPLRVPKVEGLGALDRVALPVTIQELVRPLVGRVNLEYEADDF